jgi:uncharacterized protein
MELWFLISLSIAAFLAAFASFFSGFGLGTVLLPIFLLFYSPPFAILATALVHFSNNLLKINLLKSHINWPFALSFGVWSMVGAWVGAWFLNWLSKFQSPILFLNYETNFLKIVIGLVLIGFAILEWRGKNIGFPTTKGWFRSGAILSGFFGGFSGHQGAIRTLFLLRAHLTKENLIATGVFVALLVDISRLLVYLRDMIGKEGSIFSDFGAQSLTRFPFWVVISVAIFSALLGSIIGNRYFKKTTIPQIQKIAALGIFLIGIFLVLGKI